MCPFPSTRVIPDGWSDHHRPVAEGGHTATCTITTGGSSSGDWTPGGGPQTPGAPTTLYTGTCRVQAVPTSTRSADAAGQAIIEHPYQVTIEHDAADIPTKARIRIDTCVDDPRLVGKVLIVENPEYGSLRWERVLLCDLDLTNQPT